MSMGQLLVFVAIVGLGLLFVVIGILQYGNPGGSNLPGYAGWNGNMVTLLNSYGRKFARTGGPGNGRSAPRSSWKPGFLKFGANVAWRNEESLLFAKATWFATG
jgi:hypothetical protein